MSESKTPFLFPSGSSSSSTSDLFSRSLAGLVLLPLLLLTGEVTETQDIHIKRLTSEHHWGASVKSRPSPSVLPPDGKEIYRSRCLSCHQLNGQGVTGTFPPLQDTKWVNGDKGRLIRIILSGMTGPLEVQGTTYRGVMPPWGSAMNDEEVAALSTYIRSNFRNDASPVTAKEVAKVRNATKERSKPWTAQELKQKTNQGIPGDSTAKD